MHQTHQEKENRSKSVHSSGCEVVEEDTPDSPKKRRTVILRCPAVLGPRGWKRKASTSYLRKKTV